MQRHIAHDIAVSLLSALLVLAVAGCSTIDDDLSDCGQTFVLDYELTLVTNMTTELETQLTTQTDVRMAAAMHEHLQDIFSDFAHDVDLSFYDTSADSVRLHHDEHIMDANQHSYTLYIPRQTYMHLATANIVDNDCVQLSTSDRCHDARLEQVVTARGSRAEQPDTVESHTTGVFTGRQLMEMVADADQTFNVHLYMANCAATLVVDAQGFPTDGMQVFTSGFATAFSIADSSFVYSPTDPVVRTRAVTADEGQVSFCSVTFPSREPEAPTRTIIETEEPFLAQPGESSLWQMRVYVPQADGTVTESILSVREPLRAGQLKVIKARLSSNGAIETDDSTVGVSVHLDWNPGGVYNPEL